MYVWCMIDQISEEDFQKMKLERKGAVQKIQIQFVHKISGKQHRVIQVFYGTV